MYEIEKNIDYATTKKRNSGLTAWLKSFEVGDSSIIDKSIRNSLFGISANIGIKIKTESCDEKTVRVWRVS